MSFSSSVSVLSSAEPDCRSERSNNFKMAFSSHVILLLQSTHLSLYTSPSPPVLLLLLCSISVSESSLLMWLSPSFPIIDDESLKSSSVPYFKMSSTSFCDPDLFTKSWSSIIFFFASCNIRSSTPAQTTSLYTRSRFDCLFDALGS